MEDDKQSALGVTWMDGVEEAREVGTTTYSKKLVQVPVAESVMVMVIIVEVVLERRDQREMAQARANKVIVNKVLAKKVVANKVLAKKVLANKVLASKVVANKVVVNKVLAKKVEMVVVVAIIFLQGDKGWGFGLVFLLEVVVVVVEVMHDWYEYN